jgi:hypothetical protein
MNFEDPNFNTVNEDHEPDVLEAEPELERFSGIGEYDADGLRDLIQEVRSSY